MAAKAAASEEEADFVSAPAASVSVPIVVIKFRTSEAYHVIR